MWITSIYIRNIGWLFFTLFSLTITESGVDGKIKLAPLYSEGVEWFLFLSLAKTNHQMIPFFSCIDEYGWFGSLCLCVWWWTPCMCVSKFTSESKIYSVHEIQLSGNRVHYPQNTDSELLQTKRICAQTHHSQKVCIESFASSFVKLSSLLVTWHRLFIVCMVSDAYANINIKNQ